MKIKLLLILGLVIGIISCRKAEKNFDDYFPEMTVTAVAQSDGSVVVTATITKEGALDLESIGFAFSENSDFPIDENQLIVNEIINNTFTVTYPPGFDITKTYYFKAWVTNELGYKATTAVSLSNIEAVPVDGPCSNPLNYLYVYLVNETTGTPTAWEETVDFNQTFTVSGQYSTVNYTFDAIPATGIYTTTQFTPEPGQVKISFSNTLSGFIQSSLNAGQSVYVNRTSPTTWTFEVCSATWTYNSFDYSFSTFFDM